MRAFRKLTARLGLEGKILVVMMFFLTAALAATWGMGAFEGSKISRAMRGEEAQRTTRTLALAAEPAMTFHNVARLRMLSRELLKSREIVFVAFYDSDGNQLAISHRDPNFQSHIPQLLHADVRSLSVLRSVHSPSSGDCLQETVPVLQTSNFTSAGDDRMPSGSRLSGYVSVGVSLANAHSGGAQLGAFAAGIGCIVLLLCFPIAYLMVHRIFWPIRQLVDATRRITAGDLNASVVAVYRVDAIGDLGRAFNEMTQTIKRQRQDLQDANCRLGLANVSLEHKVAQRTEQLETANRRLSREIADKEDFVRAVSHDLSAPLRNISGMAATLLLKYRGVLDADAVHRLERIQKNVEAESDLIAELLELSRIKTRRQKMERVEMGPLVRDLTEMFDSDLKTRGIELVIDTPLPALECEKSRLRQVFQNLIDNAIKYMGSNERGEIHIGCRVDESVAEFYVRDTGMGIDPQDLDRIFTVFRRGRNAAQQNISGKGVGLTSVRSIIETYGGTISVKSAPDQGSTFTFTIEARYVVGNGARSNTSSETKLQDKAAAALLSLASGI